MVAHLFVVNADAWAQFCEEMGLEPEVLLDGLPGTDTIRYYEEALRTLALTPEEVSAYLRDQGLDEEAITAGDVEESMREALDDWAERC